MGYTALYRKWRPTVFEDVIGQTHVTRTLMNQIANDNIAHAYLFSGTRGTGKTSTAKIFSRAVNCLNPKDQNPCNECDVCKGIMNESIMDVIEIDAASNNGVDDIRELRENVKYPPSKASYKVYIIDEVHMLSKGAFNALLKTLEEPPHYVIFILATTEPHKIPATIHSRCQRFEMKRVPYHLIEDHVKMICSHNEVTFEDEAIKMIVRNSDGAVRDALSILDQCLSFADGTLTHELVLDTLGMLSIEHIFELTNSIIKQETGQAMQVIDDMSKHGKDMQIFVKDYIDYLRNLMLMKVSTDLDDLIDLSKENIDKMINQVEQVELNTIIRWIQSLSELETEMKWSSQPRVLLEMGMLKLMRPDTEQTIESLLNRISKLESAIQSGEIRVKSVQSNTPNRSSASQSAQKRPQRKEVKPAPTEVQSEELPAVTGSVEGVELQDIKDKWNEVLAVIKKKKIATHALLIEGKLIKFKESLLTIAFDEGFGFHKMAVEKSENKKLIEDVVSRAFGGQIILEFIESSSSENDEALDGGEKMSDEEEVSAFFNDYSDKLEIID